MACGTVARPCRRRTRHARRPRRRARCDVAKRAPSDGERLDCHPAASYCGPMITTRSATLILALCAAGCAGNRVLVPPRLDLKPYGNLGLVTFTVENAKGSLHQFATERFEEEVLAAQPGIEILELGPLDSTLDAARAQQLGKQRGVAAVFAGHLKVTNPQASGGIAGLLTPPLEATIRVGLSGRLLSTQSGGTGWRSHAGATPNVGAGSPRDVAPTFAARDPKEAYGPLVNRLI